MALVDHFYGLVKSDDLLGPIFTDIAKVDWEEHLPKMYAFWESVLFGAPGYKGRPLPVHLALSNQTQLSAREFGRWLGLFHRAVDQLFEGPQARLAKERASRIADVLAHHLTVGHDAGGA